MMPLAGLAHTEGVEAADPATPAALLGFESAAGRYTAAAVAPVAWRDVSAGRGEAGPSTAEPAAASEDAGHMMHDSPASMPQ